jgi:hypothetical protein
VLPGGGVAQVRMGIDGTLILLTAYKKIYGIDTII